MMTDEVENKKVIEKDEIDLSEIFKKVYIGRKTIYKFLIIFFAFGLIIVFFSPKEYKSEVTLLVESGSSSPAISTMLQQFGGLTGLSLGQSGNEDALTPKLYPDVIKSKPFLLEVMSQKVNDSKHDSIITVENYLKKYTRPSFGSVVMSYTIGLPGKLIGLIFGRSKEQKSETKHSLKESTRLTPEQAGISGELSERMNAKQGGSFSTLVISVEMQDPNIAAQLSDSVVKCLTKYVIDYRTQKARIDLKFVQERCVEAENRYIQAQSKLAVYHDQNKNIVLASVLSEEQRLQSEYNLAFNLYNTISQQLEQAKIKVQERTPVFKVIDPAQIPSEKSKPRTMLILVAMIFLGGFLGVGVVLFKLILIKTRLF